MRIENPALTISKAVDVGGSRTADGTVYQNTQSIAMFVGISTTVTNPIAGGTISALIGSTNSPSTYTAQQSSPIYTGDWRGGISFIVPPGWYYKVTQSGQAVTSAHWTESS